jgi:hypothetical protein
MRAMRGLLVLTLLAVGAAEAQSFPTFTAADLEGAWIRKEGINAAGVATPSAPAVRTFVAGHFSWVQAAANRPAVDSTSTAAQLRAAWGAVTARSGTYEVAGYTMTERPIADRVPAGMAPGAFATFAIRLVADTMWITQIVNATNGVLTGQGSGKYVRVR